MIDKNSTPMQFKILHCYTSNFKRKFCRTVHQYRFDWNFSAGNSPKSSPKRQSALRLSTVLWLLGPFIPSTLYFNQQVLSLGWYVNDLHLDSVIHRPAHSSIFLTVNDVISAPQKSMFLRTHDPTEPPEAWKLYWQGLPSVYNDSVESESWETVTSCWFFVQKRVRWPWFIFRTNLSRKRYWDCAQRYGHSFRSDQILSSSASNFGQRSGK